MEETKYDIEYKKTGSESPGHADPAVNEQGTNMTPHQHTENGMSLLSHWPKCATSDYLKKTGSESPGHADPAVNEQGTNMTPHQHTENGMSLPSHWPKCSFVTITAQRQNKTWHDMVLIDTWQVLMFWCRLVGNSYCVVKDTTVLVSLAAWFKADILFIFIAFFLHRLTKKQKS